MNYLFHSLVDAARKGEKPEGRLITHLLTNPSDDGGKTRWFYTCQTLNDQLAKFPAYHYQQNLGSLESKPQP